MTVASNKIVGDNMDQREKNTLRKLKHKNYEDFLLIIRGIESGVAAGLVCVLFRFLLSKAEEYLYIIIDAVKTSPWRSALWIFALAALGVMVSLVIRRVPDSGSSGIPQVNAEVKGLISQNWWKVIIAKLFGSTVSVFSGLSLGREGPSIQFGAMAAKGAAQITRADKTTQLRMLSAGAGAGMAAAFNAPLAGVMFVMEEIHRTFDKAVLCMAIVAAVVADFISKLFFGQDTVFSYQSETIPLRWYWILILFGILCGLFGAFYNTFMIAWRDMFAKIKKIPQWLKFAFVFAVSGIVGLVLPQVLCGGHSMAQILIGERPATGIILGLFAAKFIFGAFSFCSGAPGGTLYPMCILGAYGGAAFAQAAISACGMDPSLWQDFAVLGMAGLFASIVRAPVTGIILVFEITGNINTLLPLAAVSLISYAVANTLGSTPFYTALLDRISEHGDAEKDAQKGEKVLKTYVIPTGSPAHGKLISELDWGKHCVIVSVERGDTPITPKGGTQLRAGDELVFMISQRRYAETCKKIENAINGKNGE